MALHPRDRRIRLLIVWHHLHSIERGENAEQRAPEHMAAGPAAPAATHLRDALARPTASGR